MVRSSQTTKASWELLDNQTPGGRYDGDPFFWIKGDKVFYAYVSSDPSVGWDFIQMAGDPHMPKVFEQRDGWLKASTYTEIEITPSICGACSKIKPDDSDYLCAACRAL